MDPVRDATALAGRLETHAGFELGPDEDGRFLWLGKEVPAAQRDSMLAELRAQLLAGGHADPGVALGEPQRWARGRLLLRGSEITAAVSSRERPTALLDVLSELGGEPAVVEQTRMDPRQDLPWSGDHRALGGRLHAPTAEGWERQRLDASVPRSRPYAAGGRRGPRARAARGAAASIRVRRARVGFGQYGVDTA